MKKQNLFPLLAVLLLATGLASAQLDRQAVKANIPFDFIAGSASMPAGEYRVTVVSDLGTLSVIGGSADMTLVNSHAVQANAAAATTKLIFRRYGDQYFLYRIWVQGEDRGRELPQTRLEKELAGNTRFSSVAVLAHR
jgi:hypothetical protein